MKDETWQRMIDRAKSSLLDGKNVIDVRGEIIVDQRSIRVIARDPDKIDMDAVKKLIHEGRNIGLSVRTIRLSDLAPFLSIPDLNSRLAAHEWVDWHPMYDREHWRDKEGPLKLVGIWKMPREKEETWMIMYKCQDLRCLGCRHPTSPAGQFHHKLIRPDGMDSIGRCVEIQRGRRRSENILVDHPVFRDTEFRVPETQDPDHPDPWADADGIMGEGNLMDDGQH